MAEGVELSDLGSGWEDVVDQPDETTPFINIPASESAKKMRLGTIQEVPSCPAPGASENKGKRVSEGGC